MNERLFKRCVEVASALKPHKSTGKSFHCSFAINKGKIICIGVNNYNKLHNINKFDVYKNHKMFESQYRASLHSEVDLAIRMGERSWRDYEVLNIRIDNNLNSVLSCPCRNCLDAIIKPLKPKRFYYSCNDNSYIQLNLK